MLFSIPKEQWYRSLSSKPPFKAQKRPSFTSTTPINNKSKKKPLKSTKRQNFFNEENSENSEKTAKIPQKSTKANQTEDITIRFPGKTSENTLKTLISSNINQNIDVLTYHNELFTSQRQKLDQKLLLKEYIEFIKSGKNVINDDIYIENLCNIQEIQPLYEIKSIKMEETAKKAKFIENSLFMHKVINLYNNEEVPYTFPDKLPGNNLYKNNMNPKEIRETRAANVIQKAIMKFIHILREKRKNNKKTSLLGKNILEIAMESCLNENEENLENTVKFEKKQDFSTDFTKTLRNKPEYYKDPFTVSDSFSVIDLFIKDHGSDKIPKFIDISTNPSKKIDFHKKQEKLPEKHEKSEKLSKISVFSQEKSNEIIEEYVESFEALTPSPSFVDKSKSIIKESLILEENNQSISEIMEESLIKQHHKEGTSYQYDDEKFESISEEKSLKIIKKEEISSSLEDNFNKKTTNLKKTTNNSIDIPTKNKKTVNFTNNAHFQETVELLKKPVELENTLKIIDRNNEIQHNINTKPMLYHEEVSDIYESSTDTVMDAKEKIEAFNKHDGELNQLKFQLFNVFDDLQHFHQKPIVFEEKHEFFDKSKELHARFQAEFARLMSLKTANEYLKVYEVIDMKKNLQAIVYNDIKGDKEERKENNSSANFEFMLKSLQNKQEVVFQTLLSLFQNNDKDKGLKDEVNGLKHGQQEIVGKIDEQSRYIELLLKKMESFQGIPNNNEKIEKTLKKEENLEILKNPENTLNLAQNSKKLENHEKSYKKLEILENSSNFIKSPPLKTPLKPKEFIDIPVKPNENLDVSEEIIEYPDDFEMSTPHVPNLEFTKSVELKNSQSALKSSDINNSLSKQNSNEYIGLDQLKSLSMISSDVEIQADEDFSSLSWHNIYTPNKSVVKSFNINKQSEILTDFIISQIYEDVLSPENIFPKRDFREVGKGKTEKLTKIDEFAMGAPAFNRNELEIELNKNVKKTNFNMDNFEEKSPTKMKKRKKSISEGDPLRSSLEMSVRNEGFITDTEKDVRSLESKLKRRNNKDKIAISLKLLNEDIFNKINMFNETDLKERGNIIVDAFNEGLKMNILKELNEERRKEPYYTPAYAEDIINKKFNKISSNTKKYLIKSIQNQLKEVEDYTNVKDYEFNKLYDYCRKEKYPLEEEDNLEMLEYEVGEDWEALKKTAVNDVIEECVKDVIMELNRLNNKKKKN